MRHLQLFILLVWVLFSLSPSLLAQDNTHTVSDTIKENCLLNEYEHIDFCPEYRSQVRDINERLFTKWKDAENKWQVSLYDMIWQDVASWKTEQSLLTRADLTGSLAFLRDYEFFITDRFASYFDQHMNEQSIVKNFFTTTYYNNDQWWLGISKFWLYGKKVSQYDKSVVLQITVRNYSPNTINNIEDLYCFSTLNDVDYIYPLRIQPQFQSNSVTNLIIELKPWFSSLTEKLGQKNIACTLVYRQFNEIKYTNRSTLSFNVEQ